jgi:hypothetical protein
MLLMPQLKEALIPKHWKRQNKVLIRFYQDIKWNNIIYAITFF